MNRENNIPKYRTIKSCVNEIKNMDKNSAITENFVRQLCKAGKIVYHLSGNKSLVSLDSLIEYLNKGLN